MGIDNLLYFDVETTVRCPITNNKAHPAWPSNAIVAAGGSHKSLEEHSVLSQYSVLTSLNYSRAYLNYPSSAWNITNAAIIGHNVGFDVAYGLKNAVLKSNGNYDFAVRDTAVAEYLLTAQKHIFPSLDDLSGRYVGTTKDTRLKEMWDAGVQTENIPETILLPYLKGDVKNTEKVFERQVVLLQQEGLMPLYRVQSEAQMALIDMHRNGMYVNKQTLIDLTAKAVAKQTAILEALVAVVPDVNWSSNKDVSRVFFGGTVTTTVKELVGTYKNGKDKYKNVTKTEEVLGLVDPTTYGAVPNSNGYEVSDTILKKIHQGPRHLTANTLAKDLLDYRAVTKELSTYLEPLATLTFPDSCIHANINNTATITGRYSSTNPNIQNITDYSEVKSVFSSRYGEDGVIVTADFNQLEIVGLAYLTGDVQLIADINAGVDIHTELYSQAFGYMPSSKERKAFKPITFGLVYGAGVGTLSNNTGLQIGEVSKFVGAFKTRYPGVVKWWDRVYGEVLKNRKFNGRQDAQGMPVGESLYTLPTGRKLLFIEYWQENYRTRKQEASFSPTQVKNYPVQSFATGDVVPLVLGKVFREFWDNELLRENAVLINTQHDSIIFDCKREHVDRLNLFLADYMTKVKQYLEEEFNLTDFNINVTIGVTWDKTWKETEDATVWKHTRLHDKDLVVSNLEKGK